MNISILTGVQKFKINEIFVQPNIHNELILLHSLLSLFPEDYQLPLMDLKELDVEEEDISREVLCEDYDDEEISYAKKEERSDEEEDEEYQDSSFNTEELEEFLESEDFQIKNLGELVNPYPNLFPKKFCLPENLTKKGESDSLMIVKHKISELHKKLQRNLEQLPTSTSYSITTNEQIQILKSSIKELSNRLTGYEFPPEIPMEKEIHSNKDYHLIEFPISISKNIDKLQNYKNTIQSITERMNSINFKEHSEEIKNLKAKMKEIANLM